MGLMTEQNQALAEAANAVGDGMTAIIIAAILVFVFSWKMGCLKSFWGLVGACIVYIPTFYLVSYLIIATTKTMENWDDMSDVKKYHQTQLESIDRASRGNVTPSASEGDQIKKNFCDKYPMQC